MNDRYDGKVTRVLTSTHEVLCMYGEHYSVTLDQLRALVADCAGVDGDAPVLVRVSGTKDDDRAPSLAVTVEHVIREKR